MAFCLLNVIYCSKMHVMKDLLGLLFGGRNYCFLDNRVQGWCFGKVKICSGSKVAAGMHTIIPWQNLGN